MGLQRSGLVPTTAAHCPTRAPGCRPTRRQSAVTGSAEKQDPRERISANTPCLRAKKTNRHFHDLRN